MENNYAGLPGKAEFFFQHFDAPEPLLGGHVVIVRADVGMVEAFFALRAGRDQLPVPERVAQVVEG